MFNARGEARLNLHGPLALERGQMLPHLRTRLLSLLCGALLGAPSLAHATEIYPPGMSDGPDSTHHSLGPSLLLSTGQEGLSLGFGLQYQVGGWKNDPYYHAALTAEPAQRRYGLEGGLSLNLRSMTSSPFWLYNVTADVILRLERGRLVPAVAPGVSLAHVSWGEERWLDLFVKLRAVLPPLNWESSGPRVELSLSILHGLHRWPRQPITQGD